MNKTAPLTQSQVGVFAECMQNPGSNIYQPLNLLTFGKDIDLERLKLAILKALEAHLYANCRVKVNEEGVAEQYIEEAPFDIQIEEITDIEAEKPHLFKKMALDGSQLLYFKLMSGPEANYLYFQFHHIIFDGASLRVLLRDIDSAYQGKKVDIEPISSIDYALKEFEQRQGELWKNDQQWYREHYVCDDVDTLLQPDLDEKVFRSHTIFRPLKVDTAAINRFCKENKVNLSSFFTSAYALLMSRYTGDEQVLFSTIWHGRSDFHLTRSFGMFVSTVPAFFSVKDDMTAGDLFKQGDLDTEARKHSLYSYADFCSEQGIETHQMFVYQGKLFSDLKLDNKPVIIEQLTDNSTSNPLEVQVFQTEEQYIAILSHYAHLYSEAFVEQLMQSYETVIGQMLDLDKPLKEIQVVSEEQQHLLDSFNDTDSEYDESQTIISLFKKQVELRPDKVAVVYQDKKYTYREVDTISDDLAYYLTSKGLGREDVIAILIPRCEWMAIASLGVMKAGCAYQPLDPSYPKERLEFMLQDSGTKLLIADEALLPLVEFYQGEVLLTKDITPSLANPVELVGPEPHSLMTMIYTSGTTGVPKGCQIEHRNVVAFCHMHQHCHNITEQSCIAAYASFGFDASIEELFGALTIGAELHIIPEEMRLDLMALNDYFEKNGITHSFMTTQVAYQFATNFECKSLQRLLTGGEKLASFIPPKNFVVANGYGPSEAICYVTNFDVTEERKNIPIGKAQRNVKCYIVDKFGHRLPVGAAGELWVASPQVTRGYLNRPEKTAEVYLPNPFDQGEKYDRIYRSGDIVRYLPSGDIEFVGRKDGQVKIRGFRVELKEVESVIRQFPGIKDVTVQAFDDTNGGKFIAAYIVSDDTVDIKALNNFIMDEKPPYMVPAVTMQIERIPLNQNQKVDKKALPKPEKPSGTSAQDDVHVPMNVLEQELHDIIAEIIGNEDFGLTTVLGYAGLTSIMAIKLAVQINKRFGVTLNSKSLAKTGTIQSIENEILTKILSGEVVKQEAAEEVHADMSNIPLSYAQMGVYVECMKQPESTLYNIPSLIRFPKDTDTTQLAQAVETVIKAHPQMRAHFGSAGSEIIQIVDFEQPIEVVQSQRSEVEMEQYKREFVKPYNLRQGPLYRMEIVTTEQWVYLLHDVHHLVFDGGSFDLFMNQLCDLMDGKEIEAEAYSYADFVAAEKAAESSAEHAAAKDFFQERLGNVEGVTEIPSDLTNPKEQGIIETVIGKLDFDVAEHFCRQHNLSPAHLTLAATFYALSRFTNNEQLCITTLSNGRSDLRISNTVGMFVNTLALSAEIGEQSVMEFLNETSKNFDETLRHEYYPFAQIANDYDLSAEIMFAYQVGVVSKYVCKGQTLEVENLELDVPKFRIAFYIINDETGTPCVCIQYDNGRYSRDLMQHLAQSVSNAVEIFIRQPEMKLQQVSLLDAEQTAILDSFNQTEVPYDDTQTIVSLFRKQVAETPDNMAVVYHDNKYTYREVDDITERMAAYLVAKGLGKEDVVSILIPRCEWMPIAALGVLKAGCAYQPLDPSYPAERLNFMIKDASAKLLIADESLRNIVNEYKGEVLLTKDIKQLPAVSQPVDVTVNPADLFILLYTSGSTGLPKGCQLEHRNLAAFCHWYQRRFELKAEHHVSCYASYGFDCCMMDLYPALTCGACVYIIGDDIRLTLPEVNDYFNENHITHSFMTTQVAYQFATNMDNHSLLHLIAAGEKLASLVPPTNFKLHNGYGPTEGTILITEYEVDKELKDIPVGKPLDNSRLYVVDKQFNRLPPGAMGELWISGAHVTRSYLNRPEKTAEVYLDNPFTDDPKFARIYRTGDIVRYLPDGNIQFAGRKDGQVKIRGFRIELKEVEAVIRQYPGIKDVTVQAFEYENGGKFIAAYIVSDEKVDIKELNAFIGKQKPPYMIPAATMQIDSIPLNQNQKVNRKALPAPVIQAADHEYVEPANEVECLFCKIFGDILTMDKIGATDNFFELGGTSLMVTRVIIEADKAGHHIAYGDVFANPTPRQLANFLKGGVAEEDEEARNYNYGPIEKVLQGNTLDAFRNGEKQPIGNVLVTGATGFLGIHIIKELIDRDDVPTIWCMVRAESEEKAERRLKGMLYYYFSNNYNELFGSRLRVINGDVTQDIKVDGKVDTVFNCAAVVKHFSKGTEIEDVNVGGAAHCVRFCLLNNARLIHVSTYSTAGMSINGMPPENTVYTEQKLYFGQSLNNQYVHSKFLSERVVLDAVALHKLNAKVMRVGNLAPRSTDGEFQINFQTNSSMGRIRVYQMLGCYPYELTSTPMEFSPINEVAKAIVLLSETPQQCCLFHPFNDHYVHFGDVLAELSKIGDAPRQVEAEAFGEALEAAKQDPEKAKRLSSLIAYQDMAHGQKAVMIPADNQYTSQVLYRLGFRWSSTSWDYVDQMLAAIAGFGYFEL
jgi:amino acid adenylation domain-containing protein/thioester reductase-like protein